MAESRPDPMQTIAADLRRIGMRPNRLKGQNFLIHGSTRSKIVADADLHSGDTVIEIGPGTGILTYAVQPKSGHCVLVELEASLVGLLRERFRNCGNMTIIHGNGVTVLQEILEGDPPAGPLKLISNLPYGISSPVMQVLADHAGKVSRAVVLVQKEVAERVAARPGDQARGFLSALIQARFAARITRNVPSRRFLPPPRVDSAVLLLIPRADPLHCSWGRYRALVSAAFRHRRKTIFNNLKLIYPGNTLRAALERSGISPEVRSETVTERQFSDLVRELADDQEINHV